MTVPADDQVDTSALDGFLFHSTHRVADIAYAQFLRTTAGLGFNGTTDFSVLNLIAHNPGLTSRQICSALNILPPNLVLRIRSCEERGLVQRRLHPVDHRAHALYLTDAGTALNERAQEALQRGDDALLSHLSLKERSQLMTLMRSLYRDAPG